VGWFNVYTTSEGFFYSRVRILVIVFTVFETVSAYGPVGLSFGVSYVRSFVFFTGMLHSDAPAQDNFSLSGAFATLSKLIICITMIRGRHRNLPSALDRSILLPTEFKKTETQDSGHVSQASQGNTTSRTGSRHSRDGTRHVNDDDSNTILHRRVIRHASVSSRLGSERTDSIRPTP
jgi:hypothetical protein